MVLEISNANAKKILILLGSTSSMTVCLNIHSENMNFIRKWRTFYYPKVTKDVTEHCASSL